MFFFTIRTFSLRSFYFRFFIYIYINSINWRYGWKSYLLPSNCCWFLGRTLPVIKFLSYMPEIAYEIRKNKSHSAIKSTCLSSQGKHLAYDWVQCFGCDICSKEFSPKYNLDRHLKVHSGKKPFKCDICEKQFTWRGCLQPFKCEVCKKQFTYKGSLQRHSRIHSGEKPVKCEVCNKQFSRQEGLQHHSIIHSGVKSFKCQVCGKHFRSSGTLQYHSIVYFGIRQFKCELRRKTFTRRGSIWLHARIHFGENHLNVMFVINSLGCVELYKLIQESIQVKNHLFCDGRTIIGRCKDGTFYHFHAFVMIEIIALLDVDLYRPRWLYSLKRIMFERMMSGMAMFLFVRCVCDSYNESIYV